MAAQHGGSRPGAGRPKGSTTRKARAPTAGGKKYDDALAYLEAVVRGDEPADGLRIAAARVVLPFQSPKKRMPVESPSPLKLREQRVRAEDAAAADEWETRANAVKRRLAKGKVT